MEDLVQSQIQDSCKLSLPEGLRDLMCDISREVLRAQPPDLYNFITDYLEALLITRATLSIACRLCRDVCECTWQPELEVEFKKLGLEGEDLETAKNVVMDYFDKDEVKEGNLLMKLMEKTNIDEGMMPAIQNAVRAAFLKRQLDQIKIKVEAEEANDRGQQAATHTLKVYENSENEYLNTRNKAASIIQTRYRAYLKRRFLNQVKSKAKEKIVKIIASDETMKPRRADSVKVSTSKPVRKNLGRLSSTSLAGSLMKLPKYVPYSVHDIISSDNEFEEHEKESKNIDYTLESSSKDLKIDEGRKIVFHERHTLHEIEDCSMEYEEDFYVDEEIVEDVQSNVSEKSMEVDKNITSDSFFENDIVLELISNVNGEEKYEAVAVVDEKIVENLPESEISSDGEIVEEEIESKPVVEDITEIPNTN